MWYRTRFKLSLDSIKILKSYKDIHINTCNKLSDYFALQFTLTPSQTRLSELENFFSPLNVLLNPHDRSCNLFLTTSENIPFSLASI